MGSLSDIYECLVLDLLFGPTTRGSNATMTVPVTYYIGLYTDYPTAGGTGGIEVSGGGYQRAAVANTPTNWPPAFPQFGIGTKTNGVMIDWPVATADWGIIVACALHDSPTGNQMVARSTIVPSFPVQANTQPSLPPGTMLITAKEVP